MPSPSAIFDVMTVRPPDIGVSDAVAVAQDSWGIEARAQKLSGERDCNFRLRAASGQQFVLKFANPAEPAPYRDMQSQALRYIAQAAPDVVVPRVVPLPSGAVEGTAILADGRSYQVRLLTWIDGLPIGQSTRSGVQRGAYGETLAQLQAALAGFTHPASDTQIVWDLQHALRMREVAFAMRGDVRGALLTVLDDFEKRVTPRQVSLRRQVVHNDLNRANVLVDPSHHDRIAGVIDFGDMAETPIVFDVAIAATSQRGEDMSITNAAGHLLRRYSERAPLTREEADMIPILMATRGIMNVTLACWHHYAQPDNDHHQMTDAEIARGLALVAELRTPDVADALRAACSTR